jgi:hypothetical protein
VPPASPAVEPALVHLGRLPAMVARAALLIGEVVVVPGALLYVLISAGHAMAALVAVFGWRTACVAVRLARRVRVPATCWLAFGLFLARTALGLAVSSVSLYLLVPVVLCAAQGVFFVGSAFTRRPVMMRLAADYTAGVPDRPVLRRLFGQLSAIWGAAHILFAGLGACALTLSDAQAVALTSAIGVGCTVASVVGCAVWGLWRAGRIPGLRVVCAHSPVHPSLPGRVPVPVAA